MLPLLPALVLHVAVLGPQGLDGSPSLDGSSDWIIATGQSVVYDTSFPQGGSVTVRDLVIEPGATLRVVGANPFRVRAYGRVHVDGGLDLSGFQNFGVVTLETTDQQEPGKKGGPGGGAGGTGNPINYGSCQAGGAGLDASASLLGGRGGESGYNSDSNDNLRRPGGGGGGRLGPDLRLLNLDPFHHLNAGRVARDGLAGAVQALSAVSVGQRPQGGSLGASPFADGNPDNDFFGRMLDPMTQTIIVGELARPIGGRGGGGGGNAIHSATFPAAWTPIGDEKGAGAGGGGGLGILITTVLEIGPQGRILCSGGDGGGGENSASGGVTHIGGGSGGGSGGMLLVQARRIDLSLASLSCIRALGGRGGRGADDHLDGDGAGGDGGPGITQFHLAHGLADVLLPAGKTLRDMTVPQALILLPEPEL